MNLEEELAKYEEEQKEVIESEFENDEFKMPKPSGETHDFSTEKPIVETEASRTFDKACESKSDKIESDKIYYGYIKEVIYGDEIYPNIRLRITLSENDVVKRIVQEYSFGGKYGDFNMKKLVDLLDNIKDYQLQFVNKYSYETIANSIKFLEGAKVSVVQKISENDKTYYIIDVLGRYDDEKKKVV